MYLLINKHIKNEMYLLMMQQALLAQLAHNC